MLLKNVLIGFLLIFITIIIHSLITKHIIHQVRGRHDSRSAGYKFPRLYRIEIVVLFTLFASMIEVLCWASCYILVGAMQGFSEALYFSMVTFTTLGYGDITLSPKWRVLSSLEAANGVIILGWSTALVMATVQKLIMSEQ